MSINNSYTLEKIKKALSLKIVVIAVLTVVVLSTVFYITLENYDSREVIIWFVTTDPEAGFSEEIINEINLYAGKEGIDRVLITKRHPSDQYFDVAMSTSAFYTCDAFIMQADLAKEYFEMGMFMPLSTDGQQKDRLLYNGEDAVGIKIDDNYYFLINAKTDVDTKIIYDIFDLLGSQ